MATVASQPVQLRWSLADDKVVVTPEDQDRFVIRLNRAIEILQQAHHAEEFKKQFDLLVRLLAEWVTHTSGVKHAFLAPREGALAFVVV